jgi:hypothetical protein
MVGFSTRHPRLVAALVVLATVLAASFVPRVHIDTDPENMLSRDDPVRVFHDEMKEQFAVHDMIVVGAVNEEHEDGVFNPGSLRKVYALTEYSKRLRGEGLEPGVVDIGGILEDAGLRDAPADEAEPSGQAGPSGGAEAPPPPPPFGQAPPPIEVAPPLPAVEGTTEEPPIPQVEDEDAAPAEMPPMPQMEGEAAAPAPPVPEAPQVAPAGESEGGRADGVVVIDLLAPSTVDRIYHDPETGTIQFSYLMSKPLPATRQEALAVREGALENPLLSGTVVSSDGEAVCVYLPISRKDVSYKVSQRLQDMIAVLGGPERYHITGLPVAEDTFGHEMFVQMAVSAPLAMLVIFLLMLLFFRKLLLIISPMIVALVSVVVTMGLLIGLGYTVHIMSSMIPIFIMPIAVLDAIHILSEFFDRYQQTRDRRATVLRVMEELFVPMLYTSLTSAAGFASLALTPIPPVQVFGVFVAFGILVAWLLTVTFIPAYVMFIPESRLEGFGVPHGEDAPDTTLTRVLRRIGGFTFRRAKLILVATLLVIVVAVYGISRIRINDNPTKWFVASHPIRVADRVLNEHFAGTYQAYLMLEPGASEPSREEAEAVLRASLDEVAADYARKYPDEASEDVFAEALAIVEEAAGRAPDGRALLEEAARRTAGRRDAAPDDDFPAWRRASLAVEAERTAHLEQPWKRPDLLRYVEGLDEALSRGDVVGKSNTAADIVKKVNKELEGDAAQFRVPSTAAGVASCYLNFQNSHTPDDLWHFVTPGFGRANLWLQLKSGDNRDMERVIKQVDAYLAANPPPVPLEHRWFGLTYINVAWQQKMVTGMLQAFMGSFVVVFILMTVLFHSALWGLLCMIPLTVTIGLIYGLIGLAGKDYDMPVAVLSSLTLGLAVDFAIHFLARSRNMVREIGSWREAAPHVFGEPARAISRNAIVVAVGFLPLLAAPLVPYKTVGMFMAGILAVAAVGSLFILPALATVLRSRLFAEMGVVGVTCNCVACVASAVAAVVLIAITLHGYFEAGWTAVTWAAVILIPLLVFVCGFMSRRAACKRLAEQQADRTEEKEAE